MKTTDLYCRMKLIISDYGQRLISRALAAQMLLDILYDIDRSAKSGNISKSDKNRHFVLVLQHLSLIQRSSGINTILNRLSRANLLLNSRPVLVATGLDFSGLALPEINLSKVTLVACSFDETDMRGAKMNDVQFQGCSFRRADLADADFRRSTFYGCGFEDANTKNVKGSL